ncbi:MAG: type VI secretion system baseplate subunit TssK [Holosporales bacterium]|jgi:type VI secretion system protein ImpJ|nr:type VI secretion system baseplate subunit TssK [Holosporales bacterium]
MSSMRERIFPIPLSINWHEGMLLSQHHFQQNDLRNFHILARQIRLLVSNHYGVCHLRTDNVALTDGIYRIEEIEAVFPDGLIFSFFPNKIKNLKPLGINISNKIEDKSADIVIFLAIAESLENVSPIIGNPPRFYSIEGEEVQDENISDNSVKIPRLFPNAFLHIGNTLPEFCIGFPLQKIVIVDGVYKIKNWTPPCFFIERHFPLWKKCSNLAISIREKATFLAEKLKNLTSESSLSDTEKMLCQLVQILPGFEALVYSNEIRPYELYQKLADVLGAMSALIPTDIVPVMQPYNHNDIDDCLYPVISLIEHYLSTIERGFSIIPFKKKERFFYHYLSLDEINSCKNGKIYVGLRGDKETNLSDIELWMNNSVIVSDFAVENVRIKRIKGTKRSLLPFEIVSKILPGRGIVMFEIEIDKSFIKGEQNIHIFNPGNYSGLQPTEIIFYLPRNKGGR